MTRTTFKALWFGGGGVLATWLAVSPNHGVPTDAARGCGPSPCVGERADGGRAERRRPRGCATALPQSTLRPSTRNPFRYSSPKSSAPTRVHASARFNRPRSSRRFRLRRRPRAETVGHRAEGRQRAPRSSPATDRFIWSAKATRSPAATPSSRSIRKRFFFATPPAPNTASSFRRIQYLPATDFQAIERRHLSSLRGSKTATSDPSATHAEHGHLRAQPQTRIRKEERCRRVDARLPHGTRSISDVELYTRRCRRPVARVAR